MQLSIVANSAKSNIHPVELPSLDRLLSNTVMEPWTQENFLAFLQAEYNEENLLFYLEVDGLKSLADLDKPKPKAEFLPIPNGDRTDKVTYLRAIIATFVVEKAPKQVNISHKQRVKILETVDVERSSSFEDSLSSLVEAQTEVKSLLQHGSWTRFYQKTMTQNLSRAASRTRAGWGVLIGLLVVVAYSLFMALYVPRWYIFLLFPLVFVSLAMLFQSKTQVCPTLASKGVFFSKASSDVVIACPFVLASTRKRAKLVLVASVLASIVLVLFMFSLTYAVEASRGQLGALYQ
ncbi:hypothetical protein BASA81_002457 [Batrachochytrium salamandrivorans]|nr:hypothetical protein BASA81_002457 [Batrachochytrium salamandrivorans]